MRLARRVLDDGVPLREHRRDYHVYSTANGHRVEIYRRAVKVLRLRVDIPALNRDLRAESLEALDMLVNRSDTEVASAGKTDIRPSPAPELRADQVIRPAHLPDKLIRRHSALRRSRVYLDRVPRQHTYPASHRGQNLERESHVAYRRDVLYYTFIVYQQRRQYYRHSRVLRAADLDRSAERPAAVYDYLFHNYLNLFYIRRPARKSTAGQRLISIVC